MALPTLTKTWQHNADNQILALGSALADNRRLVRSVKNAMIGFATNPWTVRYSCSSTVAGSAGDGVDRWAADSDLVWANAGSAHSWIVLRQTGIATNFEILISCENASGSGAALTVYVSPAAAFTGGSTTARPTATDEIVMAANVNALGVTTDLSCRWSVMQSTDGQCTRIILCFSSAIKFIWILDKPTNVVTGWSSPSISIIGASFTTATLCSTAGLPGRIRIGSTTGSCCFSIEGENTALLSDDTTVGNIANEVDSAWMMLPIGITCFTTGIRGRHGTIQDLWIGALLVASGDTYPSDGSNQFAQFGQVIVPWNGGAVHLS